jgi:glycosyltransferase involved in cell wall biosynthesis
MKVAVLSEASISPQHGVGMQLLRTFAAGPAEYFSLFFHSWHDGRSEPPRAHLLEDRWLEERWPRGLRGKHLANRMMFLADQCWWSDGEINRKRFARLVAENHLSCDVAYVNIAKEESALKACSILRILGCPYVVHFMDLYHDRLVPASMPGMRQLLAGASSVVALTDALKDEAAKFGPRELITLSIGVEPSQVVAKPPTGGQFRVVFTGRVYREGLELLERSLPLVTKVLPGAEFVYAGPHSTTIPPVLKERTQDIGFVKDAEQFRRVLTDSHCAFLCGPHVLDNLGKYSFPSRVADYMMAGLPIVGTVNPGSATWRMLKPLESTAITLVKTPEEIAEGFVALAGSPEHWKRASDGSRSYACAHFSMEKVRQSIFSLLEKAADNKGIYSTRIDQ